MSGIKPLALTEFYRSLKARGVTTDDLAERIGVSGATVRKLIGLLKRRRGLAWRRLQSHLTDREKQLLADVEQCSAWNIRQSEKRPKWTYETVETLRETYRRDVAYPVGTFSP